MSDNPALQSTTMAMKGGQFPDPSGMISAPEEHRSNGVLETNHVDFKGKHKHFQELNAWTSGTSLEIFLCKFPHMQLYVPSGFGICAHLL